ncbi:MAG: DUF721 domain-containing protein [Chromatiales bacterium]|nr:DUF721 domain-containing protein [Gammaproteobacteria bacterium]MBW6476332.1 DUF721 domain-containing protein [Chromatiales bacterium]
MNTPRTLNKLIHASGNDTLDRLLLRGKQLLQIEHRVLACLDIEAATHCRLLNLRDGELILGVDSPAWSSRLRYQIPSLLDCARRLEGLAGLKAIQLKLLPKSEIPLTPPRENMQMSRESALTLQSCAQHISHPPLRVALEALAARRKQDGDEKKS